jgi:hypothetical protein
LVSGPGYPYLRPLWVTISTLLGATGCQNCHWIGLWACTGFRPLAWPVGPNSETILFQLLPIVVMSNHTKCRAVEAGSREASWWLQGNLPAGPQPTNSPTPSEPTPAATNQGRKRKNNNRRRTRSNINPPLGTPRDPLRLWTGN